MTLGNVFAILFAIAALYLTGAFVRTKLFNKPTFPFSAKMVL